MRLPLAAATSFAAAALALGTLTTPPTPVRASMPPADDGHGASSALSYRARAITPSRAQRRLLRLAFARTHGQAVASTPMPRNLLAAMHRQVLWAVASFTLGDGTVVVERFRRRHGEVWRDLGATRARCPAVPPEVRTAWRTTACQTA